MKKFARDIIITLFVLVLAASMAILLLNADVNAQSITGKKWTVVMTMKPARDNPFPPAPEVRLYVVVDGETEGQAAINAHKFLSELLTTNAQERLMYLESQQKK